MRATFFAKKTTLDSRSRQTNLLANCAPPYLRLALMKERIANAASHALLVCLTCIAQ